MNEENIYEAFMTLCIAHKNMVEWEEIHGFGVGYADMMNTDNLEESTWRKGKFYSEKWMEKGLNPNNVCLDFPFVLMLPVAGDGEVESSGKLNSKKVYDATFFVFDLMSSDRQGSTSTEYSKRSRQSIWGSCEKMGEQLLMEFNKKYFKELLGKEGRMKLGEGGKYHTERVYDYGAKRLVAVTFDIKVEVIAGCDEGSFIYDETFVQKKEKFCNCS